MRTNSKSSASYAPVAMSHLFTFSVCHVSSEYFSHGSCVIRQKDKRSNMTAGSKIPGRTTTCKAVTKLPLNLNPMNAAEPD